MDGIKILAVRQGVLMISQTPNHAADLSGFDKKCLVDKTDLFFF
jgi:hypothetical protein